MRSYDLSYPSEWHPQDRICIIEALCWMATDDLVSNTKSAYAYQLADKVAAQEGLSVEDLLMQSDYRFIRYHLNIVY